jgi:hypothetical protein
MALTYPTSFLYVLNEDTNIPIIFQDTYFEGIGHLVDNGMIFEKYLLFQLDDGLKQLDKNLLI